MATNKERIENLEVGLNGVQEGLQRTEIGITNKLLHLEETLHRLSDVLLPNKESSSHGNTEGHMERDRSSLPKQQSWSSLCSQVMTRQNGSIE